MQQEDKEYNTKWFHSKVVKLKLHSTVHKESLVWISKQRNFMISSSLYSIQNLKIQWQIALLN